MIFEKGRGNCIFMLFGLGSLAALAAGTIFIFTFMLLFIIGYALAKPLMQ